MNSSIRIPQVDPRASYLAHKDEIDAAIARVLASGRYILGQEVATFEQEFADYIGVKFGIGVGNGTDALHLALRACGVRAGDEVITVSHTAVATAAAIEQSGARPVFVDIEPDTFLMSPNWIEKAITPHTKAILPVHLYGNVAEMERILDVANRYGLHVIEDCAQSHGARYKERRSGAWGTVAAFSFYPTKNLGAFGDGGMVVTNDSELATRVRSLREYGWHQRYVSETAGVNSRLDELQAAVLRVKLKYLDGSNEERRRKALLYTQRLQGADVRCPAVRKHVDSVYHLYVIRTIERDSLGAFLRDRGIQTLIHYPVPVHLQNAYKKLGYGTGDLPVTEEVSRQILSLPLYSEMPESEIEEVSSQIENFFNKYPAK